MTSDFYAVLGVDRYATDAEVRSAYRKRVRELHPDVNPKEGAQAQFEEVRAAYSVLGNPEARATFDQGTTPVSPVDEIRQTGGTLFDKLADVVSQANPLKVPLNDEEKALNHLETMRRAISDFYDLPVAADTCRAFLLGAVYKEPERSATMDAVTHLYLEHDDARRVSEAAAPGDADAAVIYATTAAIIAGAAVIFVERGLLSPDPPLGTVNHSTETIQEVAAARLSAAFVACNLKPVSPGSY